MDASGIVTLPHGFWVDGTRYNELRLRAVDANDDAFLLGSGGMLLARRANELLSRCVRPPDGVNGDPAILVRSLVAGDREALLLNLQRLAFGNEFVGSFRCVAGGCGEALELDLRVSDLLLPAYPEAAEYYQRAFRRDDACYEVRFRLPNAGDQEDAAAVARSNPEEAASQILKQCIQKISNQQGDHEVVELYGALISEIGESMALLDPQAGAEFQLTCPACHSSYTAQFDAADFLLRKLEERVEGVLRDVHVLALSYHWSEASILEMAPMRRQKYLELISTGMAAVR